MKSSCDTDKIGRWPIQRATFSIVPIAAYAMAFGTTGGMKVAGACARTSSARSFSDVMSSLTMKRPVWPIDLTIASASESTCTTGMRPFKAPVQDGGNLQVAPVQDVLDVVRDAVARVAATVHGGGVDGGQRQPDAGSGASG